MAILTHPFEVLTKHLIGYSDWEPEELYLALSTKTKGTIGRGKTFEIEEPEGSWYERQKVDKSKWQYFKRDEGSLTPNPNDTYSHRASLCQSLCFGPATEIDDANPVEIVAAYLVDTPAGDGVAISGYGACSARFYEGTTHVFRDPIVKIDDNNNDEPYRSPNNINDPGVMRLTDDGAFGMLKHMTATELLGNKLSATPFTLSSATSSNTVVECGTRTELNLEFDGDTTAFRGVHSTVGFYLPTDITRGIIGINIYSSSVAIAELFVQANSEYANLFAFGRTNFPDGGWNAYNSASKCDGGYIPNNVLTRDPFVADPFAGTDIGGTAAPRWQFLNFRLI